MLYSSLQRYNENSTSKDKYDDYTVMANASLQQLHGKITVQQFAQGKYRFVEQSYAEIQESGYIMNRLCIVFEVEIRVSFNAGWSNPNSDLELTMTIP